MTTRRKIYAGTALGVAIVLAAGWLIPAVVHMIRIRQIMYHAATTSPFAARGDTELLSLGKELLESNSTRQRFASELVQFLLHGSEAPERRCTAAEVLAEVLPFAEVSILSARQRETIRSEVARAPVSLTAGLLALLVAIGGKEDLAVVEEYILKHDDRAAGVAVQALMSKSLERPTTFVALALSERSPFIAQSAFVPLAHANDPQACDDLVKAYHATADDKVRQRVLRCLVRIPDERAVPLVIELFPHPEELLNAKELKEWQTKKERHGYRLWWGLVELDLSSENKEQEALARDVLVQLSGHDCGAQSKPWVDWWNNGNRPLTKGGAMTRAYLDMVVTDRRFANLSTFYEIQNLAVGQSNRSKIIDLLKTLYRRPEFGTSLNFNAAAAALEMGDWDAANFFLERCSDPGARSFLRSSLFDNYFDDCNAWSAAIRNLKDRRSSAAAPVDQNTPVKPTQMARVVQRYRFYHTTKRTMGRAGGWIELPPSQFGELLIDEESGRCLYEFWFDGVHEHPLGIRGAARDEGDGERNLADLRNTLQGAAAYDGQRYWAASFRRGQIPNKHSADVVITYDDEKDLKRNDHPNSQWNVTPTWYYWAPLHFLAGTIGSKALERDALLAALKSFPRVSRVGANTLSVNPGGRFIDEQLKRHEMWSFVVTLDDSVLGISTMNVKYLGSIMGNYPLPIPTAYTVEREVAEDVASADLLKLADFGNYNDTTTSVIKAAERHERRAVPVEVLDDDNAS